MAYFFSLYTEIPTRIAPTTYVGQYTNVYKIIHSANVHDDEIIISYAKLRNGNTNGAIPTTNIILHINLFFTQSLSFSEFPFVLFGHWEAEDIVVLFVEAEF